MDLKQFSFFAFNLLFGAVIDMASGVFFARRAKSQKVRLFSYIRLCYLSKLVDYK